jgi:hypothetical protein
MSTADALHGEGELNVLILSFLRLVKEIASLDVRLVFKCKIHFYFSAGFLEKEQRN